MNTLIVKRLLSFLMPIFMLNQAVHADLPNFPPELRQYIEQEDASYRWELADTIEAGVARLYHLKLTSQTWQGIEWSHDLLFFLPEARPVVGQVLMVNAGGKFDRTKIKHAGLGTMLAAKVKTPVAVLLGVPNQPLYDGLKEDHLIAETFVKYLETGDGSWPLLFPMVKSVTKAMDAIQAFGQKELKVKFDRFVLTGASKRGWTTWLTAAVDKRITAMAPMVIDLLDIGPQLEHQIRSFGAPSEQIHPYTERGLIPLPEGERSKHLWSMVDPFTYRTAYTMPKLVVLGCNDRYWSTDALNLYWDKIPEPKWISYTPNAGHNLIKLDANGEKAEPIPSKAIFATSAFTRLQLRGETPPKLAWSSLQKSDQAGLKVQSSVRPLEAKLWVASSKNLDFRASTWISKTLNWPEHGDLECWVDALPDQHQAFFVDLEFQEEELTYQLSTQITVQKPRS